MHIMNEPLALRCCTCINKTNNLLMMVMLMMMMALMMMIVYKVDNNDCLGLFSFWLTFCTWFV